LARKNNWKPVVGKRAKVLLDSFNRHFFSRQNAIVKGTPANKGIYKGVARVVRTVFSNKSVHEIKKVRKGDILIAETTGPEMMLACQKAGAIVTDEGGLTSHAAVVSRELKIPCVVGTKVATKIFKDGDIIEVDANKGTVRRIK
jgi:pyruvate,water dikinase